MDDFDKYEFSEGIKRVADAYPGQRFTDENVEAYFRRSKKCSREAVLKAMDRAVESFPQRMPTAGQFEGLCRVVEKSLVQLPAEEDREWWEVGPPPTPPMRAKRCQVLMDMWSENVEDKELSTEENHARLKLLMKAYAEDAEELHKNRLTKRAAAM